MTAHPKERVVMVLPVDGDLHAEGARRPVQIAIRPIGAAGGLGIGQNHLVPEVADIGLEVSEPRIRTIGRDHARPGVGVLLVVVIVVDRETGTDLVMALRTQGQYAGRQSEAVFIAQVDRN